MKTTYRKWKDPTSSTFLKRKVFDNNKTYVDGFYIDAVGNAVRVYAEEGCDKREPSLSLHFVHEGFRYYLSQNRPLTSDRGYALIAAKFIRDVVSGKVEPLVSNKW